MTTFNHQFAAAAPSQAGCSRITSGPARNLMRNLAHRVQAVLTRHSQVYVHHVEVIFNDDAGSHPLLYLECLQRFRQRLNTRIGQTLVAKGFGDKAGLRCEWFSTNGHHGYPNLHLLVFLGQRAFCLLGDEREPSRNILDGHISAAWAGVLDLSIKLDGPVSSIKPLGGFYLSARVGDSGVAELLEAMRNVSEYGYAGTSARPRSQCRADAQVATRSRLTAAGL